MTNLEQARALYNPEPKKIRGPAHQITAMCQQMRCKEIHLLGSLNASGAFSRDQPIWGTQAAGSLFGEWNFHAHRYDRLWGSFPAPDGGCITEDYSEVLTS